MTKLEQFVPRGERLLLFLGSLPWHVVYHWLGARILERQIEASTSNLECTQTFCTFTVCFVAVKLSISNEAPFRLATILADNP
jgi:hypothetical protein